MITKLLNYSIIHILDTESVKRHILSLLAVAQIIVLCFDCVALWTLHTMLSFFRKLSLDVPGKTATDSNKAKMEKASTITDLGYKDTNDLKETVYGENYQRKQV